eukprot:TRINITY_DN49091_c0_g1_i1.p1 TRINITY_DN49091_c0_g1~~TRINITY_DN49091_c0_g1_i1.p1  ORF type:complete len:137 (+),score=31.52 TRINITY_DN49091_c0_g1_i1:86-496(+)
MSDTEAPAAVAPVPGRMSLEEAIQDVLKRSRIHDGLARGAREAVKALDRKTAHLCVLNDTCDEKELVKLVESLCEQHSIKLIKVSDKKKLGEWAGLCKVDNEGNATKVVGTSCVVVKDWGEESEAMNIVLDFFTDK